MLPALMLAAALSGPTPPEPAMAVPDLLDQAMAHYRTVTSYRVTIRSVGASGGEHIIYYYKRPGFVRMEFVRPHAGALLVYRPDTGRVRLWPFGYGHFPELNLSPENPLIRSSGGQQVDRSDVGALFDHVRALQRHGNTQVLGKEEVGGRSVMHLVTTGEDDAAVAGVHRYELWLDTASQFPAKVVSRDRHDSILETVFMEGLELDQPFPDTLFNP